MLNSTPYLPGLSPVAGKSLTTTFDAGAVSSDGGVIVLREIARRCGVAQVIAGPLPDSRDPVRVRHGFTEMVTSRMLAIAAGYEDCNDLDVLRKDPAFKIACERAPQTGAELMSQPTLSRLENLADWPVLARIGLGLIDLFCSSFARPPKRIVLDIDETYDAVHGAQQLAMFNTHAGTTCFQPIVIFEAGTGKPVTALLRPGKTPSGDEIATILRHVIRRITKHWPAVKVLVRGDSHYGCSPVLDVLEDSGCDYILGMQINPRLKAMAEPWRQQCRRRRKPDEAKVRHMHQFSYQARTWRRQRRMIARVEATVNGTDARFIVTSLPGRAKRLYEKVYCGRGAAENLIKDWKRYTRADKTACTRWQANQFRLFLHLGAYWLLHGLRRAAPRRSLWRGATFETLRKAFVKVAVRIQEKKTTIKLAFPAAYPNRDALILLTGAITAAGP
tara:strand:+ start:393 stop:1730 length:1338 start_codon:yes stop_codon:yes gene_type:complete